MTRQGILFRIRDCYRREIMLKTFGSARCSNPGRSTVALKSEERDQSPSVSLYPRLSPALFSPTQNGSAKRRTSSCFVEPRWEVERFSSCGEQSSQARWVVGSNMFGYFFAQFPFDLMNAEFSPFRCFDSNNALGSCGRLNLATNTLQFVGMLVQGETGDRR